MSYSDDRARAETILLEAAQLHAVQEDEIPQHHIAQLERRYGLRIGNVARDPNTLKNLMAAPLNAGEMARFKMAAADMNHRFSLLTPGGNAMAAR